MVKTLGSEEKFPEQWCLDSPGTTLAGIFIDHGDAKTCPNKCQVLNLQDLNPFLQGVWILTGLHEATMYVCIKNSRWQRCLPKGQPCGFFLHSGQSTILVCLGPYSRMGFPDGSNCKASACHAGDVGSVMNLMDRRAWRATVPGVTKSRTWLSN